MLTQQLCEGCSFVNVRHNPQGVTELLTIFGCRKWEVVGCIFSTEQLKELLNFILMHKASFGSLWHLSFVSFRVTCPCAKELIEGEHTIVIHNILNVISDVVGEDVHLRQLSVWVWLMRMLNTPCQLCLLL